MPNESPAVADVDRLMDRYASGDDAAFPALHRELAPRLRGFLLRLSGSPRLADDLLQDTFLRVHRARGSFASGGAVVPWAYAIARHVFIDHTRRGREEPTPAGEAPERPAPASTSPDASVVAKQTLEVVRATLAALPVAQREAFVLVRFEGMSVAEAARVLDTSEANVKIRAFRAYEAFRAALKEAER